MKIIEMKCILCGENTSVEDNRRFCFCSYCGTRIDLCDFREMQSTGTSYCVNGEDEIRIKELEIEKGKNDLKETLIKVWVFIVVALASVAIEILLKDKDDPNSLGYLLLLVDFNVAVWPTVFLIKENKRRGR